MDIGQQSVNIQQELSLNPPPQKNTINKPEKGHTVPEENSTINQAEKSDNVP